ncbi:MAG: DUF3488 and transglutaminase-like domain-containing protein [Planctomycetota bacterium]
MSRSCQPIIDPFVLAPAAIAVIAYTRAEPGEVIPALALLGCIAGRACQLTLGFTFRTVHTSAAVLIAIAYVAIDTSAAGFSVELFADFMMLLAVIKGFEPRTPRDDQQILIISVFLALSAAVSSNELGTGALLLLYIASLMHASMRLQGDAAVWPAPVRTPRRLGRLVVLGYIGGAAAAAMVFVVVPRSDGRLVGSGLTPSAQSVTGFRDSVQLGTGGLISQDQREVLRISVDADSRPALLLSEPRDGQIRLRGDALSVYDTNRGTWSRADPPGRGERTDRIGPGSTLMLSTARPSDRIRITQLPGASSRGTIFTIWPTARVRFDDTTGNVRIRSANRTLRFTDPPSRAIEYDLQIATDPGRSFDETVAAELDDQLISDARQRALAILNQAGADAAEAVSDGPAAHAAVEALSDWLRSEKSYTLDIPPAPPGREPTLWFIDDAEAGHCEYFASSLALLCRGLGLQSRVITGYLADTPIAGGEPVRVRRADAHAWVEVETEPGRWRVYDATPAADVRRLAGEPGPLTRWRSVVESFWLSSFVSFDGGDQSAVFSRISSLLEVQSPQGDAGSSDSGADGRRWQLIAALLAFSAVCVVLLVVRLRRTQKAGDRARHGYSVPADVLEAARALQDRWNEAGTPRPAGRTLVAHASTLDDGSQADAARIERDAHAARS